MTLIVEKCILSVFQEIVHHESLWILGKLTKLLAEDYPIIISLLWYPAVAAHVCEAIYSFKFAQKNVSKSESCT